MRFQLLGSAYQLKFEACLLYLLVLNFKEIEYKLAQYIMTPKKGPDNA